MAVVSWEAVLLDIIASCPEGYDRDSAGSRAPHRDETITTDETTSDSC